MHERLLAATRGRTLRDVADLTGHSAETVRRYLAGQAPSVEFVSALCAALQVNGEWLLTGRGPMRREAIKATALKDSSAAELLTALSAAMEKLTARVERLELFVNTMETRLRVRAAQAGTYGTQVTVEQGGAAHAVVAGGRGGDARADGLGAGASRAPGGAGAAGRVGDGIADAVAQRSREGAG